MKALKETFQELGVGEHGYRVYLCLLESGSSTARFVAESLGMPRPSVYDAIRILIQKGLATERLEENKKHFQVDDVRNVSRLVEEKIAILTQDKTNLEKILPTLLKHGASVQPIIKFYSGKEGVRQVLSDMLWHSDADTFSMWSISEMISLLGEEYFIRLHQRRIAKNISVRVLWPTGEKTDLPFLKTGKSFLREAKIAPKNMQWNMSYWAYGDKVAFISSHHETFGFVIQSKDFFNLMKTQFETLWTLSKPISTRSKVCK
jgi:sugar-specific transcriptional regulator TrmB